jgi:probable phosphoglycerate mutase
MTVIGFVRHGITDWNVQKRAQGQTDIPLNETGRAQARAIADRLKAEEAWDVIYASDLSRAKETAETIGSALGLPVITDTRLREMSFGEMEGTTVEERINRQGEAWREGSFGQESRDEVAERGMEAVMDISGRHPGKRVLIVSHGALIGNTLKRLIPHVSTEEHLHNTSITVVKLGESQWDCEIYNCAKHLP